MRSSPQTIDTSRAPPVAVVLRVRHYDWASTPGKLMVAQVILVIGVLLAGGVGVYAAIARADTARDIAERFEPLNADITTLYRSLADADATVAAGYLSGGVEPEHYLEYFWGLGGEVLDPDGQSVRFPLDKAQQALEFMRKAFREGIYAPGFNTMQQEDARKTFQSEEAVFLRSWPYAYRQMNGADPDSQVAGKVGIAPLPVFAGHRPVTALGGHNLAVSAFSRNIPAAIEFVRYVSTTQGVQPGMASPDSMAPTLKEEYRDRAGEPMIALLAEVLPTAKPRPATPHWATISAEMQQQIFAAYATGNREPREAVEELRNFLLATVQES